MKCANLCFGDLLLCYIVTNLANVFENHENLPIYILSSKDTKNPEKASTLRKVSGIFTEGWSYFKRDLQKVEVISSVIWVVGANGINRNIVLAIWGRMFRNWVIITMIHILLKRGGNDNDRFPKISRPAQL